MFRYYLSPTIPTAIACEPTGLSSFYSASSKISHIHNFVHFCLRPMMVIVSSISEFLVLLSLGYIGVLTQQNCTLMLPMTCVVKPVFLYYLKKNEILPKKTRFLNNDYFLIIFLCLNS